MFKQHKIIGYLVLILLVILVFNFWSQMPPTTQKNNEYKVEINKENQLPKYSQKSIIGTPPPATGNWVINETVYITDEVTEIDITGDIIISGTLIILNSSVNLVVSGRISIEHGGLLKIVTSNVKVKTGEGIVVEGDMQLIQATLEFSSKAVRAYSGYDFIVKNNGTFEASHSTLNGPPQATEYENQITIFAENATVEISLSFTTKNTEFHFVNSTVSISKSTFNPPSYSIVLENSSNAKIENSIFLGESYTGLVVINSKNVTIRDNIFSNITAVAAVKITNSSNISLERNIIRNTRGYGLQIESTQNITISNNTFYNNSVGSLLSVRNESPTELKTAGGIYLEKTSEVHFSNNTLYNDTIFFTVANNFSSIFLDNSNVVNDAKIVYYYNMSNLEISNQLLGEIILVNCTNILVSNVTTHSIENVFTENITISSCKIENGSYGVPTWYGNNITFSYCNISGVIENSIHNGTKIMFLNVKIHDTGAYGVLVNNSKDVIIKNSEIFNSSIDLIACYNVENLLITNNTIEHSGKDAITIADCKGPVIEKNKILYTGLSGYFLGYQPSGILVEETGDLQISDNTIINSTGFGIFNRISALKNAHITLKNNFISQTKTAVEIDGFAGTTEEYVIMSNNTISNNENGLLIAHIHNLTFKDNSINYAKFVLAIFFEIHNASFSNNSFKYCAIGLVFSNSTDIIVTNNTFVDSLFFPFWITPKTHNITVTETNTVNGYPIVFVAEKNNVVVTNRQIGELMIFDCNNVIIENVSTKALFAIFVRNITVGDINLTESLGGLFLDGFSNVQIRNIYITTKLLMPLSGMQVGDGEKINITNVYVETPYYGIFVSNVTSIIISNSTFSRNSIGIWFEGVSNGVVENNIISNNSIGIVLTLRQVIEGHVINNENITFFNNCICNNTLFLDAQDLPSNVTFYFNNFIGNKGKPQIKGGDIAFDNGFVGNYWDDYNGTDANNDGIGDTPYLVAKNYYDNYPLMEPCNITSYERFSNRNTTMEQLEHYWLFIVAVLIIIAIAIVLYIHRRRKPKIDIDIRALEYKHKLTSIHQHKKNE